MGRMLAHLVKANSSPSCIMTIRTANGEISCLTIEIIDTFGEYYEKLYKSQRLGEGGEMNTFLENVEIPTISQEDREDLEGPITLKELQLVVSGMANQKSPGPDGLPMEVYKYYGEILLPELLRILRGSELEGKLPDSMLEAIIIVIHKEAKDSLNVASYRPISLLCSDVKILDSVLSDRLNKIASKLVHPDQAGFIANRS